MSYSKCQLIWNHEKPWDRNIPWPHFSNIHLRSQSHRLRDQLVHSLMAWCVVVGGCETKVLLGITFVESRLLQLTIVCMEVAALYIKTVQLLSKHEQNEIPTSKWKPSEVTVKVVFPCCHQHIAKATAFTLKTNVLIFWFGSVFIVSLLLRE